MKIGKVMNNIWATRKEDSLIGIKLMVIQLLDRTSHADGDIIVAGDLVGAGIGETVLVTQGSSARLMTGVTNSPIDAMIVGIIDEEKKNGDGES
jgi:ethanolamine utilization protein EutN